ncbi:MAG: methyltransferase domain-containing protein [Candidatus Paceibacterota bacterium]
MKQDRISLCKCGSGLKYKHCHLKLESAKPDKKLQIAKMLYEKQWSNTSKFFFDKDYYKWMAKQLSNFDPQKILDVGTGTGNGLIELYKEFHGNDIQIVGIDENIDCLKSAKANIYNKININPELIARISVEHDEILHSYSYREIKYNSKDKIVLVESDILTEPCFDDIHKLSGYFDAITVWLIGTHEHRYACYQLAGKIKSSGEYRLRVQNKVYELADKVLKPGGVLQVVDRGEAPTSDFLKNDFLNAHKDQASVTDLQVQELNYIEYEEKSDGIRMELTPGLSGRVPENPQRAFISVISLKPK